MTHVGIATQRKQCPGVTCQFQRELEMTDISIDQFPNTRQKFITTQRNGHPVLILFLPLLWPFFFLISVILSFSVSLPICLSMCLTLLLMDRALAPGVVSTFILASNHVSETQLCLPMDASGDGSKTCQSPWWQALWSACWYLLTFGVVTEHRNLTLTFNLN